MSIDRGETARSCRSPAVSLNAAAIGRRSGWLRAAFRGIPLQAAYCGSKHAIVGFTESVITELLCTRSWATGSRPRSALRRRIELPRQLPGTAG